jgi:fused signal recognition particle receptor
MAAGDTFRAAASEQLEVWAERTGSDIVVADKDKGRPVPGNFLVQCMNMLSFYLHVLNSFYLFPSVLLKAVSKGVNEGYDVVLCDTSGRKLSY